MSGRMRHSKHEMDGGALIPPQVVAVEEGRQEMLKQSHIMVDSRYFAIDPNLNFEASTILCEDRVYTSDQTPDPTQPITFTIQPQFNVFRSLSESRFVFLLSAVAPADPLYSAYIVLVPKAYWSALFINNLTVNINNVACNDQHSRTTQYASFIKTILTHGNVKAMSISTTEIVTGESPYNLEISLLSSGGEDCRTYSEGIMNTDGWRGLDYPTALQNVVMQLLPGYLGSFSGDGSFIKYASSGGIDGGGNIPLQKVNIELVYRPKDGIFTQPKLLPPGVNLNYVLNLNTLGVWCNGYTQQTTPYSAGNTLYHSANPDNIGWSYTIVRAQYYERQYTSTQTALKAYQSLIMRQPLYYSCLTSNTLLFPVASTQTAVQLTNVFSGRLPNIVVVGLLNQSSYTVSAPPNSFAGMIGNINQLSTYSPLPPYDRTINGTGATVVQPADCINSTILTVNGRVYPHLWTSNMLPRSNQDLSQWYEQYRQCSLISKLNGRGTGASNTNLDVKYVFDNPLLSFEEFKANFTFLCYNIRRNGTIVNDSGDKEVGGIDVLVNINGSSHPNAQLLVVGLNTDSLMTITDGGSTTSFVF